MKPDPSSSSHGAARGRVVVTDWTFPDLSIEEAVLRPSGCEFVARACKTEAELIALAADADCVITQFARLTANVIAALRRARAIVRYGVGVDNIDLEAARARGIPVCNVPDYCVDEVADHTLAFILASTRQIVPHALDVRDGHWRLAMAPNRMPALRDLVVGVAGCGRIGRAVVRRLLPFQCRVQVHDPAVPVEEILLLGGQPASWDELLAHADILTLHCPSTAQTRRMLNRAAFAKLKPGAILINVGRGDLVETTALVEALETGRLAGAALDVFDPEPIPSDLPVLKFANVLFTPHIASVSPTAGRKLRETVAQLALRAVLGQPLENIVNR